MANLISLSSLLKIKHQSFVPHCSVAADIYCQVNQNPNDSLAALHTHCSQTQMSTEGTRQSGATHPTYFCIF